MIQHRKTNMTFALVLHILPRGNLVLTVDGQNPPKKGSQLYK